MDQIDVCFKTAGRQISREVLCEYWSKALESKLGKIVNLPEFPAGDKVLRNLWSQIPIEDEEIPVITTEQTRQAVYNLSNGTAPGYNGLTVEIWKLCDHTALCRYLKRLLQYVICVGYVPATWKIGIVTFLPKPDKPDAEYANPKAWRPITILPTINKIIGNLVLDGVSDDVQSQLSSAQKGGIKKQLGASECTFLLRSITEHHRRNQTDLCIVFLDATNAFGSVEPSIMKHRLC